MTRHNLSRRLEDFRLQKQMTLDQLAVYLRISRGTLTRLRSGKQCYALTRAKIEQQLSKAETETAAA